MMPLFFNPHEIVIKINNPPPGYFPAPATASKFAGAFCFTAFLRPCEKGSGEQKPKVGPKNGFAKKQPKIGVDFDPL